MLRCIALSACAATVAGLLSFLALRRLGGIESGPIRRPHRAQHGENRLDSLTYSVTRYVPMSEKVADAVAANGTANKEAIVKETQQTWENANRDQLQAEFDRRKQ